MSFRLMAQVLELRGLRPLTRMVLVVLADATNPKTGRCYPGLPRIMRRAGASRGGVLKALALLERGGWITIERRRGRVNHYTLHLDQSTEQTGHQSKSKTGWAA